MHRARTISRAFSQQLRPHIAAHSLPRRFLSSTDELGMPIQATWSVKELLASYPPPVLEPSHLFRLHKLSALNPPPEGSQEFEALRVDLGELVRLVEAVKTVNLPKYGEGHGSIPDGRIWQDGRGMSFDEDAMDGLDLALEPEGRELMGHASETKDGFYLVKSERRR